MYSSLCSSSSSSSNVNDKLIFKRIPRDISDKKSFNHTIITKKCKKNKSSNDHVSDHVYENLSEKLSNQHHLNFFLHRSIEVKKLVLEGLYYNICHKKTKLNNYLLQFQNIEETNSSSSSSSSSDDDDDILEKKISVVLEKINSDALNLDRCLKTILKCFESIVTPRYTNGMKCDHLLLQVKKRGHNNRIPCTNC